MESSTRGSREDRWRRLLIEHERSGLSAREFARRKGISVNTLGYWKYRRRVGEVSPETSIVPVRVVDEPCDAAGELSIDVDGAVIRVPAGTDLERVARLICLLRRRC